MSIALNARIKEMQERFEQIKENMRRIDEIEARINALEEQLLARLPTQRKPGRPPKNG